MGSGLLGARGWPKRAPSLDALLVPDQLPAVDGVIHHQGLAQDFLQEPGCLLEGQPGVSLATARGFQRSDTFQRPLGGLLGELSFAAFVRGRLQQDRDGDAHADGRAASAHESAGSARHRLTSPDRILDRSIRDPPAGIPQGSEDDRRHQGMVLRTMHPEAWMSSDGLHERHGIVLAAFQADPHDDLARLLAMASIAYEMPLGASRIGGFEYPAALADCLDRNREVDQLSTAYQAAGTTRGPGAGFGVMLATAAVGIDLRRI